MKPITPSVVVAAFAFAVVLAFAGLPQSIAQEKGKPAAKYEQKELLQNEKVRVGEVTWAPGGESPSVARPARVVRVLKGGTLERIFPDGKKETVVYKTGDTTAINATPPYAIKNTGKSDVVLFVVFLK